MLFPKESSGHRAFEIKRQLVSDVSADDELGCRNTLEWAKKDVESVLRVLNENVDPLLHKAAAQGNSGMLQLSIENRANVNLQERTTERTALHEAMDQGHACASWAFISAEARQDLPDAKGQTALSLRLLRQRVRPESESVEGCVWNFDRPKRISSTVWKTAPNW